MRSGKIPFQFDLTDLLKCVRRTSQKCVTSLTLNLPFLSIEVNPEDKEKQIARELVIRLRDRRVITSFECCDDCIDRALGSLQEIRRLLIDKEVELSDLHDGPLFLFIDAMTTGIRQFLTFEQQLKAGAYHDPMRLDVRQSYFDGLEVLRGHLHRCLGQIALIAAIDLPAAGLFQNYKGGWQLDAYKPIPPLEGQP